MISEYELILMLWDDFPLMLHQGEYSIEDIPVEAAIVFKLHRRGLLIRRNNGDFTLTRLGCEYACEMADKVARNDTLASW